MRMPKTMSIERFRAYTEWVVESSREKLCEEHALVFTGFSNERKRKLTDQIRIDLIVEAAGRIEGVQR